MGRTCPFLGPCSTLFRGAKIVQAECKAKRSLSFAFSENGLRLIIAKAGFVSAFGLHRFCRGAAYLRGEAAKIAKVIALFLLRRRSVGATHLRGEAAKIAQAPAQTFGQ